MPAPWCNSYMGARSWQRRGTVPAVVVPSLVLLTVPRERSLAGVSWTDHGLLFASGVGTPIDPSDLRRAFGSIAKRSGLDVSFPCMLRHRFTRRRG